MKTIITYLLLVALRLCVSIIVIVLVFAPLAEARVKPETAVGSWLFDEEKVDAVKDASGNENDGLVKGPPEWIEGPFGNAVEFTNSSQSVEVPDTEILNFGEESFSVVIWFNFSNSSDWSRIVRERNPGPWAGGNSGWELQTQGTQVHWSLDDSAGNHNKTTYPNTGDGEWHHTAMIVNREEEKIVTYLDGQNEKTAPIPTIKSVTGVLPVTIGGGVTGAVDEVGIFNVVLTLDDVVDIMNKGLSEILAGSAVSPSDRLTTTWGDIKRNR